MRTLTASVAGLALSALGVTAAGPPGAAAQPRQVATAHDGGALRAPAPGSQLWADRLSGTFNPFDRPSSLAVSPDGKTVFITAPSGEMRPGDDYVTAAYSAATGAPLWTARYSCLATSVAVSPTGHEVFVTGTATIAYNSATGALLWAKPYHSRYASSVAVSPDGTTVAVTGTRYLNEAPSDDITIAYRASGTRLWTQRYGTPAHDNAAAAVAISPDGRTTFITGRSGDTRNHSSFDTIAYRTTTGTQLWTARYNKPEHQNYATMLAVSPASGTLYVTGDSQGPNGADYATVAYDPATGARLWVAGYNSPANGDDHATAVAASPHGTRVFVTGSSPGSKGYGYLTIAYQG